MKIGDLARATGTKVETIRFYEAEGLIPPPARSSGNYRIYEQAHLARLSFIRRARDLGFTLDQVRTLLRLADDRDAPCAESRRRTSQRSIASSQTCKHCAASWFDAWIAVLARPLPTVGSSRRSRRCSDRIRSQSRLGFEPFSKIKYLYSVLYAGLWRWRLSG